MVKAALLLAVVFAFLFGAAAQAELKSFTMPDGSTVTADVPAGMTYTQDDAIATWKTSKAATAGSERRASSGSDLQKLQNEITYLQQSQAKRDYEKARDIMFEREQIKNDRLKEGKDTVRYNDINLNATIRRQ
jgi:hypothetical protein